MVLLEGPRSRSLGTLRLKAYGLSRQIGLQSLWSSSAASCFGVSGLLFRAAQLRSFQTTWERIRLCLQHSCCHHRLLRIFLFFFVVILLITMPPPLSSSSSSSSSCRHHRVCITILSPSCCHRHVRRFHQLRHRPCCRQHHKGSMLMLIHRGCN